MFTVKFPELSHTSRYRLYLVYQERILGLWAQLYHGCPLVSVSEDGVYELAYAMKEGIDVVFVSTLKNLLFEFEDFPRKSFEVDLTETWKPRTLYFL
jgi:hypothetical protein